MRRARRLFARASLVALLALATVPGCSGCDRRGPPTERVYTPPHAPEARPVTRPAAPSAPPASADAAPAAARAERPRRFERIATGARTPARGAPRVSRGSVSAGGKERSYALVTPSTFDAKELYPVVLAFHGDGSTGDSLRGYFRVEQATGEDALVVYPDATGGGRAWDLETRGAKPNADVDFVRALVSELEAKHAADPSHVFATGWSNGGFFVSTLACRAPSLIRAIASHAGGAPYDVDDRPPLAFSNGYVKCTEKQVGVPAFVVHGALDRTVTPDSGDFNALYWATINGCDVARARAPSPTEPACGAYACPRGHEVTYCRPATLGHGIWERGARASWAWFLALR